MYCGGIGEHVGEHVSLIIESLKTCRWTCGCEWRFNYTWKKYVGGSLEEPDIGWSCPELYFFFGSIVCLLRELGSPSGVLDVFFGSLGSPSGVMYFPSGVANCIFPSGVVFVFFLRE